jgi:excisionase family DNA binding protein
VLKTRTKPKSGPQPAMAAGMPPNGPTSDILTLSEAAAYLRLPEQDVVRMVHEQDLPARQVGAEWRFFKTAIQQWLSQPPSKAENAGIWAFAGAWKDDPHVEEMLQEIYRQRGRPMTEED